jgi:hypothetical protein
MAVNVPLSIKTNCVRASQEKPPHTIIDPPLKLSLSEKLQGA